MRRKIPPRCNRCAKGHHCAGWTEGCHCKCTLAGLPAVAAPEDGTDG